MKTFIFKVNFENESYIQGSIIAKSLKDAYKLVENIPFKITIEQTNYEDNSFLNENIIGNQLIIKKEINLFNDYGALSIYLILEQKKFPIITEIYKMYLIDFPIEEERESSIEYIFNYLTAILNNENKENIMSELKELFHFENLQSLLLKIFYI